MKCREPQTQSLRCSKERNTDPEWRSWGWQIRAQYIEEFLPDALAKCLARWKLINTLRFLLEICAVNGWLLLAVMSSLSLEVFKPSSPGCCPFGQELNQMNTEVSSTCKILGHLLMVEFQQRYFGAKGYFINLFPKDNRVVKTEDSGVRHCRGSNPGHFAYKQCDSGWVIHSLCTAVSSSVQRGP